MIIMTRRIASLPVIIKAYIAVTKITEGGGNSVNETSAGDHAVHNTLDEVLGHIGAVYCLGEGDEGGEGGGLRGMVDEKCSVFFPCFPCGETSRKVG